MVCGWLFTSMKRRTAAFWQLLSSRPTFVAMLEGISVHLETQPPHSLPDCKAKYSIQLKTEVDAHRDPTASSLTSLI